MITLVEGASRQKTPNEVALTLALAGLSLAVGSALVDGLAPNGTLMTVGASTEPLAVAPLQLIVGTRSIRGWASGTAKDSQDTLEFSALSGVRPMIERYPLQKAAEAYEQMLSGRARFRVVLKLS